MKAFPFGLILGFLTVWTQHSRAELPSFEWKAVTIDTIEIGYGLQLTDVDGDGKTDIVLADKTTVQWYQNPTWKKYIIARDLTERDNVCISARDIDGDGKCEIAVGGQWNFGETVKDGAVHYLIPPSDRTRMWTPVKLYNEPSTHRMHWIKGLDDTYTLAVKPLRGRGNLNDEGYGLMLLEYTKPSNPRDEWTTDLIANFLHQSHNFHPVNWDEDPEEELIIAAKEGVWHLDRQHGQWRAKRLSEQFAGEIRDGRLPNGKRFFVTIEPMHGVASAVYSEPDSPEKLWDRIAVLDDSIRDGHALAVADFLGVGNDQVVVGWRGMNPRGVPGIKLFTPTDPAGSMWRETRIAGAELAVEDIKAADLNADGRPDIVAAARQTKNLVIFFNETAQ
jgi:hypothetical protein